MAFSTVQTWNAVAASTNFGTTVGHSLLSIPTAGNLLVALCGVSQDGLPLVSLVDDIGDGVAWTLAIGPVNLNTQRNLYIYYKQVGTPSGAGTKKLITLTSSAVANNLLLEVAEYTNTGAGTYTIDGTPVSLATQTGTNPTLGNITTTGNDALIVGAAVNNSGTIHYTAGTGFTETQYTSNFNDTTTIDKITTSAGNYAPAWVGASSTWSALGVAFKFGITHPSSGTLVATLGTTTGTASKTALGAVITSISAVISGSNLVVSFHTSIDLTAGVAGFGYSIGAGTPIQWQRDAAGTTGNQYLSIPLADLGISVGDVVNVDPYYSTTNPAGTIVYASDEGTAITVVSASTGSKLSSGALVASAGATVGSAARTLSGSHTSTAILIGPGSLIAAFPSRSIPVAAYVPADSSAKLQLYNTALTQYLGERRLATLSENREPRRALDDMWSNGAAKYMLEQGHWKFAQRAISMDYTPGVEPSFGFNYLFEKPADCVRLSKMCSDEYFGENLLQYSEEAGFWAADLQTIYVSYVSKDPSYGMDISLWPQTFVLAVASYLAMSIAKRIGKSQEEYELLKKEHEKLLIDARSKDAMQGPTVFLPSGSWSRARTGGRRRDGGSRGRLIG